MITGTTLSFPFDLLSKPLCDSVIACCCRSACLGHAAMQLRYASWICLTEVAELAALYSTFYAPDLHREGHCEMGAGVCPSTVCLSRASN